MSDSNLGPESRRDRRPNGPGFSAARGAALVAIAVIVGIVLLQAIDDGNNGPVGDGGASTTTSTTTASTSSTSAGSATSDTTSATTAKTTLPPAQVTVRVLNGSGTSGAAGSLTNTLKAKGYKTLVASDASPRTGTVIYVKTGSTAECQGLVPSVPGAKLQPMPTPIPGGQDANCIVVLGS